jgi:hypothetical protein
MEGGLVTFLLTCMRSLSALSVCVIYLYQLISARMLVMVRWVRAW